MAGMNSIHVATNRGFEKIRTTGTYRLRDQPNRKGPRELRMFEAVRDGEAPRGWGLHPVPDKVSAADLRDAGMDGLWKRARKYSGSQLVAGKLIRRLRANGSNFLFFIHGYNTNVYDALNRAERLARRYNLEVVVFSWPSNGGGDRFFEDWHGKASYLSDKSDARASTEALDRALARMHGLLGELNRGLFQSVEQAVRAAYPEDRDRQREETARRLRAEACPFKVTLLAHSMGNYLLKKMLLTSSERLSRGVVFDNVILKAADTNHEGHADWVERLQARKRVYITFNLDDHALALSNLKIGEQQQPRLGSTLRKQHAANATYVDFTHYLDKEHSYFDEADIGEERGSRRSKPLTRFFDQALNGEAAETGLPYFADTNTYRVE